MDIEDGHRLGSSDVFATEACGGATHLIGSSLHDIPAPREKPIATDLASGACFGFPNFRRRSISKEPEAPFNSSSVSECCFVLLQTELDISRMAVSTESGRLKCHGRETEEVFIGGEDPDSGAAFGGQGVVVGPLR